VSQTKDQYSEADAVLLQEVANQVALAVENMNSYEEIAALNKTVARTADQLRTLLEINNAIITNLSEEALLRSVSHTVRRVVPFDRAALTLYAPEREAFRYLAVESRLTSDFLRAGLEFKSSESISAWVFDNQRAVVRRDLENDQRYSNDRLCGWIRIFYLFWRVGAVWRPQNPSPMGFLGRAPHCQGSPLWRKWSEIISWPCFIKPVE